MRSGTEHGAAGAAPGQPSRALRLATLAVGLWAMLPPFVGPGFTTAGLDVELIDHPLPALVALAVVAWAGREPRPPESRLFVGGLVIVLAGIWMTAAHAPLVLQAGRGQVGWAATVHHSLPGIVLLGVGALWSWRMW